jgi:hypothetical protein
MTISNPSFNQIRERSTGEKSSQPRWLFPFLFLGANLVIATGLVVLRVSGWLQIEQSFVPLLVTGVLLSGSAALVLFDLHRQRMMLSLEERKHFFTLGLVVPVLVGMLAVHPAAGLSLPGIYFFCLTYFMAFAGVLEWLNREAAQSRESELLTFHDHHSPVVDLEQAETCSAATSTDNEALFAALLGQGESALCDSESESGEESCSQWMNRSVNQSGEEMVEGGIRVHFQQNQRIQVVHLGLNPPLEGVMAITSEVEDGAGIRTRVLESRPYGVSIEVKRTQDLDGEFQSLLHYQITSCTASEDVA